MSYKIYGIGEVLWDLLPTGRKMGGAPANFAYHARALGTEGSMISCIGADALGTEIIERLKTLGLPTECISIDPEHPTGTVQVELAADGQPRFTIHENVAWDHLQPTPALLSSVAGADAVCFGSLAQRSEPSRSTIRQLVAQTPEHALRVFDVNLRQNFYSHELLEASLQLANVLKLNDAELPIVTQLLGFHGTEREQLAALLERYQLRLVICTRGENGSILFDGKVWSEFPGLPARIVDTIGAGDAFTAAATVGFLAGWPLDAINRRANEVAAFVCENEGGTPPLPAHLRITDSPASAVSNQ